MNGEIRDRERVMRILEKSDTPIFTGMQMVTSNLRLVSLGFLAVTKRLVKSPFT
jgi:hypothetical protein